MVFSNEHKIIFRLAVKQGENCFRVGEATVLPVMSLESNLKNWESSDGSDDFIYAVVDCSIVTGHNERDLIVWMLDGYWVCKIHHSGVSE